MDFDVMLNEDIVYEIGILESAKIKCADAIAKIDSMVDELVRRGVLVENDGCGNGWNVVMDGGIGMLPSHARGYVFSEKGYAFLYWLSVGRDRDVRLVCISSPLKEEERISHYKGERVDPLDVFMERVKPKLSLVKS